MSNSFPIQQVIALYKLAENEGISLWLDGGWGVDALLGKQTRTHDDLDVVIREQELEQFLKLLESIGFAKVHRQDCSAWNFVLSNQMGLEIDVHVIHFDVSGNGMYGPKEKGIFYPAYAFPGQGQLNGVVVKCITAQYQIESHTGYALREKDLQDVRALCEKFNLMNPM